MRWLYELICNSHFMLIVAIDIPLLITS